MRNTSEGWNETTIFDQEIYLYKNMRSHNTGLTWKIGTAAESNMLPSSVALLPESNCHLRSLLVSMHKPLVSCFFLMISRSRSAKSWAPSEIILSNEDRVSEQLLQQNHSPSGNSCRKLNCVSIELFTQVKASYYIWSEYIMHTKPYVKIIMTDFNRIIRSFCTNL